MDGHVIALRNHAPFGIKDRAGIIATLFDVGRERSAPQRRAHLFRHRSVERAVDFKCGWIELPHWLPLRSGRGLPPLLKSLLLVLAVSTLLRGQTPFLTCETIRLE